MKNPDRRQAESGFKQLSFLPEPEFTPQWPNPHTQPAKTLTRLLAGERLTQPSYGLTRWRLAAYCWELRKLGWPIQADNVACTDELAARRPIREYWLPADCIKQIVGALSFARYEQLKRQWDDYHPAASSAKRDAAMLNIARDCGV